MMSVRCFQVLLAEAGRGGLLIVLEGSITIVLVACICQCNQHEAGSYGKYRGDVHLGASQAFAVLMHEIGSQCGICMTFYTCIWVCLATRGIAHIS